MGFALRCLAMALSRKATSFKLVRQRRRLVAKSLPICKRWPWRLRRRTAGCSGSPTARAARPGGRRVGFNQRRQVLEHRSQLALCQHALHCLRDKPLSRLHRLAAPAARAAAPSPAWHLGNSVLILRQHPLAAVERALQLVGVALLNGASEHRIELSGEPRPEALSTSASTW